MYTYYKENNLYMDDEKLNLQRVKNILSQYECYKTDVASPSMYIVKTI